MLVTRSYENDEVVPEHIRTKYDWLETNNAAAILQATSPEEYADLMAVLETFELVPNQWMVKGGNRGEIPDILDGLFRTRGWKETRIDTEVKGYLYTNFVKRGGNYDPQDVTEVESVYSEGFRVDNHKGRVIVDVEWNAKDGNLDRDLAAYRSWHELGLINGAAIITKSRAELLELARRLYVRYQRRLPEEKRHAKFNPSLPDEAQLKKFKLPIDLTTSTVTAFDKAEIRVKRQGAGTCPILIVGVGPGAWSGDEFTGDDERPQHVSPDGWISTVD
ncbi:BglII/BstYI family type II restriction endonuclease [Corynebacterium lubricantis]|uniref:BglII/BstYI family type II restriction endonuclease n=1 Tax=Corynebacterium lubricantis TaxID=541095 RepID=UPI00036ED4BE|nr:BglII/BstYI family type II restriction endonuclease [Corynebacterium lubricantis]